eukprot:10465325-Alexandrium_andersonii.AAC.1
MEAELMHLRESGRPAKPEFGGYVRQGAGGHRLRRGGLGDTRAVVRPGALRCPARRTRRVRATWRRTAA